MGPLSAAKSVKQEPFAWEADGDGTVVAAGDVIAVELAPDVLDAFELVEAKDAEAILATPDLVDTEVMLEVMFAEADSVAAVIVDLLIEELETPLRVALGAAVILLDEAGTASPEVEEAYNAIEFHCPHIWLESPGQGVAQNCEGIRVEALDNASPHQHSAISNQLAMRLTLCVGQPGKLVVFR